jgi:hypothetical protein
MRNLLFYLTIYVSVLLSACSHNEKNKDTKTLVFPVSHDIYFKPIPLESNELNKTIIHLTKCNNRYYVGDMNLLSLGAYEIDGTFIESYSSRGRGPGDFEVLGNMLCLSNGNIVLRESARRLHYFDPDLNFIKTKTIANLDARLYELLAVTDSVYIADILTTKAPEDHHFVIIDRETHGAIEIFGYGVNYQKTYLPLKINVYDNNRIISGYIITGEVRVLDLKTRTSFTFMTQFEKSIDDISKGLSGTFDTMLNERDIEVLTRGRAIHYLAVLNNEIFVIRDFFTHTRKEYIEVFDMNGNPLRKYPLQYNIDKIIVINEQLYGFNRMREEDFTIYRIYID